MSITRTHHAQSSTNIELLNFVNQRSSASFTELFAAFGDGSESTRGSSVRFSKKLEYLLYTGRLIASGRGAARVFYIGPEAGKPATGRGRTDIHAGHTTGSDVLAAAIEPPRHYQCNGLIAAPRQFNTIHDDGTYMPPMQTALRPGSLDFKRYASHGHQC